MRLRIGFVGTTRRREIPLQPVRLESAVQAFTALPGRNGQRALAREALEQLANPRKQQHRILARKKMLAVEPGKLAVAFGREARHCEAQRILQAEPDDVA